MTIPKVELPEARIRTQLTLPIELPDGFETTARVFTFDGLVDGREHLALGLGDRRCAQLSEARSYPPLVRLHSECLTGDAFGSQRCDCGPQLREAVERISEVGGYLLYLRQEGRGIGLYAKLDAYALQDQGLDTYAANRALGHADDERDYTSAAQMLSSLEVSEIDLLTNNPDKPAQLRRLGIGVRRVLPTGVYATAANVRYLQAKASRSGHTLALPIAG